MIKAPFLLKNDTIAIVAPAGKIDLTIVEKAASVLESWGLNVVVGKHLSNNYFGFSANDQHRLADFQEALNNPRIRAILCARGGYGTNRIIDQIDFTQFSKNPKWLIGFSDITVLHNHIHRNLKIETIHGSMCFGLANENASPETSQSLKNVLFGKKIKYEIELQNPSRKGEAEGILTGGNLAILCSLIGTKSDIDTKNKILFLEEIGEPLYRIDRMITQLKRTGKLQNLAGIVAGGFDKLPDSKKAFGKSAYEIIMEAVRHYDYPVLSGFPAGHGNDNRALILGRNVKLEIHEKAMLTF